MHCHFDLEKITDNTSNWLQIRDCYQPPTVAKSRLIVNRRIIVLMYSDFRGDYTRCSRKEFQIRSANKRGEFMLHNKTARFWLWNEKARVTNIIFHFRRVVFREEAHLGASTRIIRKRYFEVAQFPSFRTRKLSSRGSDESFAGGEL